MHSCNDTRLTISAVEFSCLASYVYPTCLLRLSLKIANEYINCCNCNVFVLEPICGNISPSSMSPSKQWYQSQRGQHVTLFSVNDWNRCHRVSCVVRERFKVCDSYMSPRVDQSGTIQLTNGCDFTAFGPSSQCAVRRRCISWVDASVYDFQTVYRFFENT